MYRWNLERLIKVMYLQAKKMLYGMVLQQKELHLASLSLPSTSYILHAIKKKSRGFKIGHY